MGAVTIFAGGERLTQESMEERPQQSCYHDVSNMVHGAASGVNLELCNHEGTINQTEEKDEAVQRGSSIRNDCQ